MLIESGEKQHYCYVKRVSALLYNQTKNKDAKHFCLLCLAGYKKAESLAKHEKYCNGVNGRPTRIEMPSEEEKTLKIKNHHKTLKAPYVIYADFESLIEKIPYCEPQDTLKTEKHKACGYSFTVVRSDGEVIGTIVYRGKHPVKNFFTDVLEQEKK